MDTEHSEQHGPWHVQQERKFAEQRLQLSEAQQQAREKLNAKLRQERQEAEAAERKAQAQAKQKAADEALKEQLRTAYLKSPAARPEDFEAAWPKLRAAHLRAEAVAAPMREKRALAASDSNYTQM